MCFSSDRSDVCEKFFSKLMGWVEWRVPMISLTYFMLLEPSIELLKKNQIPKGFTLINLIRSKRAFGIDCTKKQYKTLIYCRNMIQYPQTLKLYKPLRLDWRMHKTFYQLLECNQKITLNLLGGLNHGQRNKIIQHSKLWMK